MIDTERYRVSPGAPVDLADIDSADDGGLEKSEAKATLKRLCTEMRELQPMLFADARHALLVVLQAMDAGGKDSTIRSVFGHLNPQGCRVTGFRAPSELERRHDYLWRIHRETPSRGLIRIFNRSHYEDVLVVRVKGLVPPDRWQRRYDHINAFEKLLHDEGTTVLKFYLHISKAYQKQRLERRLARPDKHWKFNPGDLVDRARWDDYRAAFEDALSRCSTGHAPWYVVPAERRWYRNLLIARVVVDALQGLELRYPEPDFDPASIEIE